jgi:DNA helicase II / ATP-dependent DNA helicase PcrA
MITLSQLYKTLREMPGRNIKLNDNQLSIIEHDKGPLWIIAGPGSGKTEVLVLRCLKLLLVDGVDPRSIMITTFTEKAGRNLNDRLMNYKAFLSKTFPELNKVDLFQLRVGTLHSLCNSIMLEYRYPGYKFIRYG